MDKSELKSTDSNNPKQQFESIDPIDPTKSTEFVESAESEQKTVQAIDKREDEKKDEKKGQALENEKVKQLAKLDEMMSSNWAFETEMTMIGGIKNFGFRFKSDLKITLADLVEPIPKLNYDEMKTLVQNTQTFDELQEAVFKQIKLGFHPRKVIRAAFSTEKLVNLVTERILCTFKTSIEDANRETGLNLQTVAYAPSALRAYTEDLKSHYQKTLHKESIISLDWVHDPRKCKNIMSFILSWFCNFAQDFNAKYRYSIEFDKIDAEKLTARLCLDIVQE